MRLFFKLQCALAVLFMPVLQASAQVQDNDTAKFPYWTDMMQRPGVNFAQVQHAFQLYWQDRKVTKGSGWKPFKRWENYWQYRLDSNGNIPPADEVWKSYYGIANSNDPTKLEQFNNSDLSIYDGTKGNWKIIGPVSSPNNLTGQPNGNGRINAIGFHPTDSNTIYIGAPAGGFWISTNYGQTWKTTTDSLPTLGVSAIVSNYNSPSTIYMGTGDRDGGDSYSYGVMKSTDGGQTWNLANTGMGSPAVGRLIIHPSGPDTLLAATSTGIYKTVNSAGSWTKKASGNFKDIVYKPGDPRTVYATADGSFYRSTDGGDNWTAITSGLGTGQRGVIAVTPANPNYVYYLLSINSVFKGLYRSTNSGSSFSAQSTTPNILGYAADGSGTTGQAWYDLDIAADPNNANTIYAGGVNIFKSTDGGVNWTINAHWTGTGAPPVHADQHVLEYSPLTKGLYIGNDGGIYFTKNGGTSWTDISSGIANSQIYRMGQSTTNKKLIINGYQDNGTSYFDGAWKTILGGDGMDCLVDYTDPDFMVGSLYYGAFTRFAGGNGATFGSNGNNGITEDGAWITPLLQHNRSPNIFFIGYKNIWKTNNGRLADASTISWRKITDNLGGSNTQNIAFMEQNVVNQDILYFSRGDNKFFRSDNINDSIPSWTDLTSKLPQTGVVSSVETSPVSANRVYITLGKKVYRSNDKGLNWTDITGNIPALKINTVVLDTSKAAEELYVGTDVGVYYKNFSTMTNWAYFNAGLPLSVNVNELEIFYDKNNITNSKIRAATYGRGAWESDLYNTGNLLPVADFTADQKEVCVGSQVTFEDNTGYIPYKWKWTFTPNTVTYINNTNDTLQNVTVKFNSGGNYTVKLIAVNNNGTDTIIKENYIYAYDTIKHACVTKTTNAGGFGIGIYNVTVANISNNSKSFDQNGTYEDYTCDKIIQLQTSKNYTISVTTGGFNDEFVKVFIDYNGDGDFKDFGELVWDPGKARTNHSGTFTTPTFATLNKLLRMRVISDFSAIGSPDCPTLSYGQSEDYGVYFDKPSATISVNNPVICSGQSVTVSATTAGKVKKMDWNFGPGASPATASGTGPFTVSYTSAGYKKITLTINDTVVITKDSAVSAGDKPKADFIAKDTLSCTVNGAINFTNTSSVGAGTLSYTWAFGDATNSTATHPFKTYSSTGTYQVMLKASSSLGGCPDSVTKTVVAKKSMVKATFTINKNTQCQKGNNFVFTNTSPAIDDTLTYTWKFGDGAQAGTANATHVYTADGAKNVTLVLSSNKGCKDSVTSPVMVNPQPAAAFTVNSDKQCLDGNSFAFTNSSSVSSGTLSYQWNFGNSTNSTLKDPAATYANPGSYVVTLKTISDKGCEDSLSKNMTVFAMPDATFTWQQPTGKTVQFTPTNGAYSKYEWDFGNGQTSFTSSTSCTYSASGNFTVQLCVTDNNNCKKCKTESVSVSGSGNTGLAEPSLISKVNILPNPFDKKLHVSFQLKEGTMVNVSLTDIEGRKVLQIDPKNYEAGAVDFAIDTEQLAKGIYFIHIEAGNEKTTQKLVK